MKGASFVSVTQAFNTTNNMGRLTLNVLLSFAQFEREVTEERIRDKIAASKARGMWMDGSVPPGYEVKDRKLVVAPDIVAAILDGRQPVQLNRQRLARATNLPLNWQGQRAMLGFV
jgi:DNA invertase Pin-like site-specific DNA recombinase